MNHKCVVFILYYMQTLRCLIKNFQFWEFLEISSTYFFAFQAESFDDRHVLAKHQTIYPDEATLEVVQDIVVKTEKALKIVSDKIYEEDKAKAQEESLTTPIEVRS